MPLSRFILFALLCLCSCGWATDPFITEFMAENEDTLADVDGDHPDWIEVYNPNPVAVSLADWSLTDNFTQPGKWHFPAVTINANSYLIVFASGKNRTNSLEELHTNFSLDADGDKLALVKPDGTTFVSQFTFGAQNEDVSYGLTVVDTQQQGLVASNAPARALVPANNDLQLSWTTTGFNDGAWQAGTAGIGYDTNPDYLPYLGLNVGPAMNGICTTCYIRIPFNVSSLAGLTGLKLRMRYDDGFVAYINGTPVAARNEPGTLVYNSASSGERQDSEAVVFEDIDISQHLGALVTGPNVLAIHGLNLELPSSDFLIQSELIAASSTFATSFMPAPTPGAANSTGTFGFVDKVEFSTTRGFFSAPFNVALGVDTPGAEIRYTKNGSTPTASNGTTYIGPILIDKTTTLRAAAFKPGWTPSKSATHTFLFVADVVQQSPTGAAPSGFPTGPVNTQVLDYGMDPNIVNNATWGPQLPAALTAIPTVSLVTDAGNLFDLATGIYVNASQRPDGTNVGEEWERPSSVELIYPSGAQGFQENGGIRIRGNFSREGSNAKHGFKVVFKNEYGPTKLDFPLFGNGGARDLDRFDLRTMQDNSWSNPYYSGDINMHAVQDPFCRVLMRDLGLPYTRGFFVHLYLNGQYWGLYNIEERPVRGWAERYLGGQEENYDVLKVNANQGYTVGATDGNMLAWQTLFNYSTVGFTGGNAANYWAIQGRNAAGADDPNKPVFVDMDNFIGFMVTNFYTGNHDGPISADLGNNFPNNFYVLRDRTDRHRRGFVCATHDMERTLLSVSENRHLNTSTVGNQLQYFNPQYLHNRLRTNPEYALRFADWVHRTHFNNGPMTVAKSVARFNTLTNEISMAIIGESARWGDAVVEPPRTKQTWQNAVNSWLANYFPTRTTTALSQFQTAGLYPSTIAPVFSPHGGTASGQTVTITDANSGTRTTYVTTDGSDPRAIGGGVGATAVPSTGSVVIPAGTTRVLRARVLLGSTWSALNEAVYAQVNPPLRITEIMFHPATPSAAEKTAGYTNADEFEFLELQNIGGSALNLYGCRLTSGVDFGFGSTTLAADARIVLARNRAAFQLRHGFAPHAEYLGSLDNAGDHLTLVDAAGNVILDFDYSDGWFAHADGEGFSLVIRDPLGPTTAWQSKAGWRTSTAPGGSPGAAESALPDPGTLVISEVLSHTASPLGRWIELRNLGTSTVELSGWRLSDDALALGKYQFPPGLSLASGAHLVVFENTQFGPASSDPGRLVPFSLSEHGGDVWLSSPAGGYREHVDFGPAASGVSFGRHVKSTGTVDFPPLSAVTFGTTNAAPAVGPMVIDEILYHPLAAEAEFIELRNLTGASVTLDDWKLTKAVSFTFPAGSTIGAHGYALVVGVDPAAFRTAHGIPAPIPIFGPWQGVLDNDGEQLELKRPAGNGDFLSGDRVQYADGAPWPIVGGYGLALARQPVQAYGNDPASWQVIAPSRGAANTADTDGDGQPDAWELAHALHPGADDAGGDLDRDGQSNLAEYLAGTLPGNPASVFRVDSVTRVGGAVRITFTAQPGKTYTVQYRDSLTAGAWLKLADVPAPGAVQQVDVNDNAPPPGRRLYRVVTPAQ